jgi:ribosomal-protein-alanine N-acetyltransferase
MISQVIVDECHLLNICIHPDYQGNGYGQLSLNWLEQLMREKDVASLLLEVRQSNLKAQGLYKKLGFEQIGLRKDYYPADSAREAAIVMRKLL